MPVGAVGGAQSPEVSGRAFLGIIRHVKEKYGAPALQAAVSEAGPATQKAFAGRILHAGWYPYDSFTRFLSALELTVGRRDPGFGRALGAASGVRDINTVFRIYLAIASPERLIRSCSKVWPGYYRNAGTMEAVAWEPEKTVLRITGFDQMAPIHCRLMEGWMIATMDVMGLRVHDDGRETACPSKGAAFHEFTCTWSKK